MRRILSAASVLGLAFGVCSTAHAQSAPASTASSETSWFGTYAVPAPAPGPYVRLNSGYSFGNSGAGNSWLIGGGLGWRFSPNWRADLTLDYRPDYRQDTNFGIGPGPKTGLDDLTAMANGYYDFTLPMLNPLVPYIGGGIGVARNSYDGVTVQTGPTTTSHLTGSEKDQFAWQAMAGVSYYFSPSLALDVGYRYLDAGNSGFGTKLQANEVTAGLRFGF